MYNFDKSNDKKKQGEIFYQPNFQTKITDVFLGVKDFHKKCCISKCCMAISAREILNKGKNTTFKVSDYYQGQTISFLYKIKMSHQFLSIIYCIFGIIY